MPRHGRLLAPLLGLLAVPGAVFAQGPRISIANVFAQPGEEVVVPVSLELGNAPFVRGIRNDVFPDPLAPTTPIGFATLENGEPDCAPDADLVTNLQVRANFSCLETTTEDVCVRLRAQVISELVQFGLPNAMIYECLFRVDPSAAPGSYPIRMNRSAGAVPLAFWRDAEGQEEMAVGVAGSIIVVAPTATATESPTGTSTPSETPTVTPTMTPSTPTPTPTVTQTPVVLIRALAGAARPGLDGVIGFDLADRSGNATELGFDMLVENAVFAVESIRDDCAVDARLASHVLSITLIDQPPPPAGLRLARVALFDRNVPADTIGDGPVMSCALPVKKDAPLGTSAVRLERAFAGDADGLIAGVQAHGASIEIDPEAEPATPTPSFSATPVASPTSPSTPTPTSSPTLRPPSPTPSATPDRSCAGDCDGDSLVDVAEAIRAVNIALGLEPMEACDSVDINHDDGAGVDELLAAVSHLLNGCPPAAGVLR